MQQAREVITVIKETVFEVLCKPNREIRQLIRREKPVEICGRNFWNRKMGIDITCKYNIAHKSTRESRLRLLHFKILHNIFPSNILLNRLGIKNTELCEHCGVKDFIEHMFIHCSLIKNFWQYVFNTICFKTSIRFPMNDCNILFGFSERRDGVTETQLNTAKYILLIARMCVSKVRYREVTNAQFVFDSETKQR